MKIDKLNIVFIAAIVVCLFFIARSCQPPGKGQAQEWMDDMQQDLNTVAQYLKEYPYPDILIDEEYQADGTMKLLLSEPVAIENDEVVKAIDRLFAYGVTNIYKNEKENTIQLVKYIRFRDFNAGLLYSLDGANEPTHQYLTKLEPLSQEGWYYYEADYNEWRLQNR